MKLHHFLFLSFLQWWLLPYDWFINPFLVHQIPASFTCGSPTSCSISWSSFEKISELGEGRLNSLWNSYFLFLYLVTVGGGDSIHIRAVHKASLAKRYCCGCPKLMLTGTWSSVNVLKWLTGRQFTANPILQSYHKRHLPCLLFFPPVLWRLAAWPSFDGVSWVTNGR